MLRGDSLYPTCDDFHPSFDPPADLRGGFVGVRVFPRYRRDGKAMVATGEYVVSVYGAKTSAMHVEILTIDEARTIVRRLPSVISIDHLRSIGFRWA